MEFKALKLHGCYEIRLDPHHDERGYFMRTYDRDVFRLHGLVTEWLQESQSMSLHRGTLRGLHFQVPPHAETKLVRALAGAVQDVFIDLRADSPTFGQWESVELAADQFNLVYIPKGFAHGFCTLTDNAIIAYHVDACYAPRAEGGVRWNDTTLKISWPVDAPLVSKKDQALPAIKEFTTPFALANTASPKKEDFHVR